jgi:ComF family protein
MHAIKNYLNDLLSLFFPDLCAGCGTPLFKNETVICTNCIYNLPVTNFHKDPENKLSKQLWGRFAFRQASAFVYFRKGGRVQNIIHQLKYNKRPEAGFRVGELYAYTLLEAKNWEVPDLIVPVPLHRARLRIREYNQSQFIAEGMASVLSIPVDPAILIRAGNTETQTRKSRFSRYENLKGAFVCRHPELIIGKHILLVDDVVTTGATLEACSLALLEYAGVSVSIVTLAFAE